jgi:hypothetical protein
MADLINRYGFLPQGTTLRGLLAVEYRRKLEQVGRSVGLPVEALDRMRPWLAAITLTSLQAAKADGQARRCEPQPRRHRRRRRKALELGQDKRQAARRARNRREPDPALCQPQPRAGSCSSSW